MALLSAALNAATSRGLSASTAGLACCAATLSREPRIRVGWKVLGFRSYLRPSPCGRIEWGWRAARHGHADLTRRVEGKPELWCRLAGFTAAAPQQSCRGCSVSGLEVAGGSSPAAVPHVPQLRGSLCVLRLDATEATLLPGIAARSPERHHGCANQSEWSLLQLVGHLGRLLWHLAPGVRVLLPWGIRMQWSGLCTQRRPVSATSWARLSTTMRSSVSTIRGRAPPCGGPS